MNEFTEEKLKSQAGFLYISIPYDKDDDLITFDDGVMTELKMDDEFVPPMLNIGTQRLEFLVDLETKALLKWNIADGYLRMRAKVRDSGTYTLLDKDEKPICQICGYVPNKLIPPFENGAGDYIELAINADGTIDSWPLNPDLSEFAENGESPRPIKTNKWHKAEEALWHISRLKLNKEELNWLVNELTKYKLKLCQHINQ